MEARAALEYLNSLQSLGSKLGLERIEAALKLLENPEKKFKSIHIAGTNGKGSTCAFLSSILQEAGFKAGMYTSPHLLRLNERIKVNNEDISDEELVELILELKNLNEKQKIGLTYFEFLTALAFLHFAKQKVDYAVVEVGMGGRLDATNVILPEAAVITNIGREHEKELGSKLPEIAKEKAGVIKENSVVFTAVGNKEILDLFEEICKEKNSKLVVVEKPEQKLNIPLIGEHQQLNANLAVAVANHLEISASAIESGLQNAKWPGRFEIVQQNPTIIFDAAHNPSGMRALKKTLQEQFPGKKFTFVVGVSSDKKIPKIAAIIAPLAEGIIATQAKYRGAPAEEVAEEFEKHGVKAEVVPDVKEALAAAKGGAKPSDVICVCGSIFVLGEAKSFK